MRPLRVLLVCFGFLFGLLIAAVGLLIDWAIGPYRTNLACVDGDTYGSLIAIAIDSPSLYCPVLLPLLGALLGWVVAIVAARRGWRLSQNEA
ncbi:hypothetical protein ACFTSD_17235 [Nocardiaceae bacterium NPDC056970]